MTDLKDKRLPITVLNGDALLCLVGREGVACHTLRLNCFYFDVDARSSSVMVNESVPR